MTEQTVPPAFKRPGIAGAPITDPYAPLPGFGATVESEQVAPTLPPPPEPRSYQWNRVQKQEFDVELPSGSFVRLRKLSKSDIFKLNIIDALDSFSGTLIDPQTPEQRAEQDKAATEAIVNPEKRDKLFSTVDRVVLAAVVSPKVVGTGETTDHQINVEDIEIDDKFVIFREAFGEQMDALKSIRTEQAAMLGSVPESENVQPES